MSSDNECLWAVIRVNKPKWIARHSPTPVIFRSRDDARAYAKAKNKARLIEPTCVYTVIKSKWGPE